MEKHLEPNQVREIVDDLIEAMKDEASHPTLKELNDIVEKDFKTTNLKIPEVKQIESMKPVF